MLNAIRKTLRRFIGSDKPVADTRALQAWQQRYLQQRAAYDAARTTEEYRRIWANADRFDADSAHSKEVRHTLISRRRYEINSNGYSDGIAQTISTDLVGVGPSLRMQTGSEGFNRMIELEWFRWCKAVQFRRKLWCMAHAKHSDGEAFGVMRRNPRVRHRIPLDLVLYEAEQISTPNLPSEDGYIDGIKFDKFGNPQWYDLIGHPGSSTKISLDAEPERIPADFMLHWFKMRRPGQHRGVPECSSTLNVGAAARRWREATLAAAETAADFSMLLESTLPADSEEIQELADDFSTQEINKRMMTAIPLGYKAFQMKAEQPTAQYEMLHKQLVNEQARPVSMPYNKAACDSSSYNYASGRLDHQTYYAALDVEREDCNELVLDPLFLTWFDRAIVRFGWLGGNPEAISDGAREHLWDWPKHRVADVEAEANANQTKLESGQTFHHTLFTDAGLDFEDELEKAAQAYGVTPDELRKRLLDVTLPEPKETPRRSDEATLALAAKLNGRANGHAVTN